MVDRWALKFCRQSVLISPVHQTSLEWLVYKVQERIVLTTLRRSAVKNVRLVGMKIDNYSCYQNLCYKIVHCLYYYISWFCWCRHSVEYIDRDETIVAHLCGEVYAFLQLSQGWPLMDSPLKLKSLKYCDNSTNRISFDIICKVQVSVFLLGCSKWKRLYLWHPLHMNYSSGSSKHFRCWKEGQLGWVSGCNRNSTNGACVVFW